jgi:exo-1,4-beta-D-glucosaminidase
MNDPHNISLGKHWKIRSSEHISQSGNVLSTDPVISKDWLPAIVPSTVLGTLTANKVYEDPYFGENLKSIPTDPFKVPWWYTTVFQLKEDLDGLFARLYFDGINYKANIWLNGKLIADINQIDGAYRRTSFEVTDAIVPGNNLLAIEVVPPKPGDFSTGFVDWNPAPPDGNMGIFRPVTLKIHRGVHIENPFVNTHLDFKDPIIAQLSVSAEIHNDSEVELTGKLIGKIGKIEFGLPVTLPAKSKKEIVFDPESFPQLALKNPPLWWPVHLGEPHLHDLDLKFLIGDKISDTSQIRFGIRQVSDYWLNGIHRGFKINGRKVLIKGAGWTDDLLLMDTHEKIEAQVKYVKQMNLNCIRLEGIWGKDHKIYDLCDEHGILLMVGWSCHWEHEVHMGVPVSERFGAIYKSKDIKHVAQAWEDQVIWLRNHPSIFVWTVASDKVPITQLEEKYIETFAKYDPTRPYLNSTGGVGSDQHVIGSEDVISEISGSSGVKMLGPYAYTPPVYWYTDAKLGGAYGFNTETGPGVQVPQLDSLKKFIPQDRLWPINEIWDYHCGRYEFSTIDRFTRAINERYGIPDSIEEFDKKAQAMNYELMRPMFEAFRVNKQKSTGVIQWMLNGAWPKMYWQLYDYYLNPNGAFYAAQKACAPLQLVYNYGNHQIYAINDHHHTIENLSAKIRVLNMDAEIVLEKNISFDADSDSAVSIYRLKAMENRWSAYFLDLRLYNSEGKGESINFYWLSTREDILDYEADLGPFAFHTPSKQYADLHLLNSLPEADLGVSHSYGESGTENRIAVTLKNQGNSIAFLINLKLYDRDGELILPVFWDDNFTTLLPDEQRTLHATFEKADTARLRVEGWNVKTKEINLK